MVPTPVCRLTCFFFLLSLTSLRQGDGTLDSSEMMSALTTLGDVLSEAQCSDLLALADGKGRINIVVLSKYLLAQ